MPKGILVVTSGPSTAARDAEYNAWYNDVHLVDVLKVAGFTAATRYKKVGAAGDDAQPYLAIYEVEGDDLNGALGALAAAGQSGELTMSDVLATDPVPSMTLYEHLYGLSS
jgi:hypothetical protein